MLTILRKENIVQKHKWYNEIVAWASGAEIEQYHSILGWIAFDGHRDHFFEANEYRIKPQPKCTVKDCQNHVNEGKFIGDLCAPCWDYLTNGKGIHSQAYRNAQNKYLYVYEKNNNFFVYNESPIGAPAHWQYFGKIEVQND